MPNARWATSLLRTGALTLLSAACHDDVHVAAMRLDTERGCFVAATYEGPWATWASAERSGCEDMGFTAVSLDGTCWRFHQLCSGPGGRPWTDDPGLAGDCDAVPGCCGPDGGEPPWPDCADGPADTDG